MLRECKIFVAKTAGFCFGVDRAVKIVYNMLDSRNNVVTLGPIIHNPNVVSDLKAKGVFPKELSEVKPDCTAVAFDLKAPTFRHKANSAYKANRKGMPEELAQQMPVIKELLEYLGVRRIECEGFEADDIIGTLSHAAELSGNESVILTGDRDSFQLVTDKVTVRLAGTKETKVYTPERIKTEYGVSPRQMIEVKALMGDTSDNISGIKGIGEKTALALIQECGSVDGLYEKLADIKLTPSVRTKIENGRADAYDSRFLAEISLEAPINTDLDYYMSAEKNEAKASQLLSDLEMLKMRRIKSIIIQRVKAL